MFWKIFQLFAYQQTIKNYLELSLKLIKHSLLNNYDTWEVNKAYYTSPLIYSNHLNTEHLKSEHLTIWTLFCSSLHNILFNALRLIIFFSTAYFCFLSLNCGDYFCPVFKWSGVDFINFLRPIRALRPTFEKLFIGVRHALRRALSFDREKKKKKK